MAGRRPLQRRVALPRRPAAGSSAAIFGTLFCRKSSGTSDSISRVAAQRRERVVARGEGVHEHERQPRAEALAQPEHLADDDVEEGLARPWPRCSDLALVMPMLVPRPPLSLSTTAVSTIAGSPSGSSSSVGQVLDGLDVALGQHPRRALAQLLVVVGEGVDRGVADALGAHLLDARLQPVGAHAPSSSRCTRVRREGGQADGDVLGAAGIGRRVAAPTRRRARGSPGSAGTSITPVSCSTRRVPSRTSVHSSKSGRWPGSTQPSGERMRATLRRSSPVLTRPTYSSISFGLVPAASTRLGLSMSCRHAAAAIRPAWGRSARREPRAGCARTIDLRRSTTPTQVTPRRAPSARRGTSASARLHQLQHRRA